MTKVFIVVLSVALFAPLVYSADTLPSNKALNHRAEPSKPDTPQASSQATVTIPAQTEAAVQLLSGIHTQVSHVGDPITARLLQPVLVNGRVALPSGSLINGRITQIRLAGRMRRPAEMALSFDRITFPDGQDEAILADLSALDGPASLNTRVDSEGRLKGTKGFSWKGFAGGLISIGGLATLHMQLAGAAALGTSLPIGGGAVLGYTFLWPRGKDVHLPPETHFRIRLHHPLTVRVAW